jgi:hypothetical protein
MRKSYLCSIITIVLLLLPHVVTYSEWFLSSEMPDAYEGLPELANLSFVKQFFGNSGHLPLWNSMRNSGMPLTFFLLPGWWVWSFPLMVVTLILDEIVASKIIFSLFAALSSVSMYVYGRKLSGHRVGSVLAGWIYSSSGTFLTIGLTHLHINFAIFWAFIPLVFLFLDEMLLNEFSLVRISITALLAWVAFSSQPLFFLMSFVPFMVLRALLVIYTKAKSDWGQSLKSAFTRISIFTFLFLALNLWWILPQFSYQTLYLTPVYVDPVAVFSADKPLSTHTLSEVVSMQTFAGGGTEFLKDPGIAGLRSFGFFLPFSLSMIAPVVCRKNNREVRYLFACFCSILLLFLFTALGGLPFPNKVASQPFFASCLSAFALKGIFEHLSHMSVKDDACENSLLKRLRRKGPSVLLLMVIFTLVLSAGFVEMHRLTNTYDPPEELDEAYAFLSSRAENEDTMILNIPFITPIGKPYYSPFKPDNFIGYYYSYLADYLTVTHGLRNSYGPINEYEPNRYVSSTFLLLDGILKKGHFNDFVALLYFLPDLSYIVIYRDLVGEDVIWFFQEAKEFKLVYENPLVLIFENMIFLEAARTRIADSPLIVSTRKIGSGIVTLGSLLNDMDASTPPLVLFDETAPPLVGSSVHAWNTEGYVLVCEAEDLVLRSEEVIISEPFNRSSLSPSNGESVSIRTGVSASLSFDAMEKSEYALSFRVFHSSQGGVLLLSLDGQWLGSIETSSSTSHWGWSNFTATLDQGRHEITVLNASNSTSVEHIDVFAVSKENNWNTLLWHSLLRTFATTSETNGSDVVAHLPSDIGAPSVLVLNEAYFPSWTLSANGREHQPLVVNAFSTGFIISESPSGVVIRFTLSLEEQVGSLFTLVVLLAFGALFFTTILKQSRILRGASNRSAYTHG